MYETVIFSAETPIGMLRLNRPEKLNAFGGPMREEILDVVEKVGANDELRVLIITGEGRGFSAGADITHLKRVRETNDEAAFRSGLSKGQAIARGLRALPKPVIAAVNGPCAGAGLGLA